MIYLTAWRIYPEHMLAQNTHNGTWAQFYPTKDGWAMYCVNCPAQWMFAELANWFCTWITNQPFTTTRPPGKEE